MGLVGYKPMFVEIEANTANTALITHAKKTYALLEADLPFHMQIEKDGP